FWDVNRSQWDNYEVVNVCEDNGSMSGGDRGCGGLKAMSLIPAKGGNPADPTGCNAIAGLDAGLTVGQTPTIDYSGCWTPVYITNSSHQTGSEPAMASQIVSGLSTDADGIREGILTSHIPNSALVVGGNLYIEWDLTRKGIAVLGSSRGGDQMGSGLMDFGPTSAITSGLSG